MPIQEQQHKKLHILKPLGPLAHDQADQFKTRGSVILNDPSTQLVVDLSCVTSVDSRGLEALVDLQAELVKTGRTLNLCGVNVLLTEVLTLTDLVNLFDQFRDLDAAKEALA